MTHPSASPDLGSRVRNRREQLGLTRAQLAHQVGCAVITLRKIESGERRPSRQMAELLLRHLALSPEPVIVPAVPATQWVASPTPSGLIGRAEAVAQLVNMLSQPDLQLLTLTGSGGVGKTRLAAEVVAGCATLFADGTVTVELASLAEAQHVPAVVLQALGHVPDGATSPQDALVALLRAKHLLLCLDNFEHVTSAAPWLAALLGVCPGVKALVTSRHALGLPNEARFTVPPLALPASPDLAGLGGLAEVEAAPAVQLFVQRARSAAPGFQLADQNAAAVAEICRRLDGLPLAIELVAARTRLMSPQALLARLVDAAGRTQLDRVADGNRDTSGRHRRLRDILDWSYALLTSHEQAAFQQLAVFRGGWTLDAAEATLAFQDTDGDEAVSCWDALTSLLDKSLIQQRRIDDEDEPRFTLLETVREYALEKLAEAGALDAVRSRQARYFCEWAEAIEPVLVEGTDQARWLVRVEREHDNVRAVLQWSLNPSATPDGALSGSRLAAAFTRYWWIRAHWAEGRDWLERARVLFADETAQTSSLSLAELNRIHSRVLRGAGLMAWAQTDLVPAERYTEQALALARPLGDKVWTGIVLGNLATIVLMQGDYARGKALTEEALALDRAANNVRGVAFGLGTLGELAFAQGDYALAEKHWIECIEMYRARGDENSVALTLVNLSAAVNYLKRPDAARAYIAEGLALARKLGNRQIEGIALQNLAELDSEAGDTAAVQRHYVAALRIAGDLQSAAQCCSLLTAIGSHMAEHGHWERGAMLYGAAMRLREQSGSVMNADERDLLADLVPRLRQHLGDAAYARAYEAGAALSLDEAIALAAGLELE